MIPVQSKQAYFRCRFTLSSKNRPNRITTKAPVTNTTIWLEYFSFDNSHSSTSSLCSANILFKCKWSAFGSASECLLWGFICKKKVLNCRCDAYCILIPYNVLPWSSDCDRQWKIWVGWCSYSVLAMSCMQLLPHLPHSPLLRAN